MSTRLPHHYQTMVDVFKAAMDYTHLTTLIYGIAAVVIMVVLKKINRRIPNVLVAVAVTTLISYYTGYNKDVYVDLSALRLDGLQQQIADYNSAAKRNKNIG